MDDIKQRLKDTSENCLKAFEAWEGNKKDVAAKGALQEAIHEIRKVTSRLEIEVATSEGGEGKQKPLPIPPHRSKRRRDEDSSGEKPSKPKGKRGPKKPQGDAPSAPEEAAE